MAQGKAHKANAAMLERQAEQRLDKAHSDVLDARVNFERHAGRTNALVAASGIDRASFADLLLDDAIQARLERERIAQGGEVDASNLRYRAASERSAGRNAVTAGYINAASSVVGGFKPYVGPSARAGVSIGGPFSLN
jgi:hypothetical protein